jgi:hypothetical protein
LTVTGATTLGQNLTFTGTGNRITGDFNNGTIANRLMFQGSVVNGGTVVTAIPNGTSASCQLVAANASDPTNAQIAQVLVSASEASFRSGAYGTGTGTYLPMTFYTGGSERVRVNTLGNVGIGTTTPTAAFQGAESRLGIEAPRTSADQTLLSLAHTGTITALDKINIGFDSFSATAVRRTMAQISAMNESPSAGNPGSLLFYTNAGAVSLTERMRITSAGDVFVGGTTGAVLGYEKFSAYGTGSFKSASSNVLGLWNTANPGLIQFYTGAGVDAGNITASGGSLTINSGAAFNLSAAGANIMTFSTNSAERMRIDSSGNVGIGTSSPVSQLTLAKTSDLVFTQNGYGIAWGGDNGSPRILGTSGGSLSFKHGGGSIGMVLDSSGNLLVACTAAPSSSVAGIRLQNPNANAPLISAGATTSLITMVAFINGNGTVGQITTNGSATAYVTSSDYRLKHDIQPMTGALAKVTALKPCTYKWNADNSESQGFIAHELAEVCPDAVSGEKDAVNEDGSIKSQGIDTSFLVATLTAAIQEQQALITALTTRITALEST